MNPRVRRLIVSGVLGGLVLIVVLAAVWDWSLRARAVAHSAAFAYAPRPESERDLRTMAVRRALRSIVALLLALGLARSCSR